MASLNGTNITASISTDLTERNVIFTLNAILSPFGIVGNVLVVILIARNSHLRKHCKYLQASLAAGDAILCLGQMTNAIFNLIIVNSSLKLIRWMCLFLSIHGAMGIMYSMIMTAFIAFDRYLAIGYPLRYRNINKKRVSAYCSCLALTVSGACAVGTFLDVDLYDYPSGCLGSYSRSAAMSSLINYFNAGAGLITLIIYPMTLALIRVKTGQMAKQTNSSNLGTSYFVKQVEATSSITLVVVSSLIIVIIPNLMVIILKSMNTLPLITTRAPSYIAATLTLHSSVNCLFYVWKDKKIREAFLKLVPCRHMNTVDVQVVNMTSAAVSGSLFSCFASVVDVSARN